MLSESHLREALSALGNELGVALELGENHRCVFTYEGDLELMIEFIPYEGKLVFAAAMMDRHLEPGAAEWPLLCLMNWLGKHTRGGTLTYNPETKAIVLWRPYSGPDEISADSLREVLEQFLASALSVQQNLAEQIAKLPALSPNESSTEETFLQSLRM